MSPARASGLSVLLALCALGCDGGAGKAPKDGSGDDAPRTADALSGPMSDASVSASDGPASADSLAAPAPDAGPDDAGDAAVDDGRSFDPDAADAADGAAAPKVFAVQLAVGLVHACARMSNGTVRCWGDNSLGQLGDRTRVASTAPVMVVGIAGATDVAASRGGSCAVLADRTVRCWGDVNDQLSNGPVAAPKDAGVTGAVAITGGRDHVCAVLATGHVACWGRSIYDQLGGGGATVGAVEVLQLAGATAAAAGFYHACALGSEGSVWCWGDGLTGVGAARVPGLTGATAVSASSHDSCVVVGASVSCWADDQHGETAPGWVPAPVSDVVAPRALAGSCALLADGTVSCWRPPTGPVARVPGLDHVRSIAADGESGRMCAIRDPAEVWCWQQPGVTPVQVLQVPF